MASTFKKNILYHQRQNFLKEKKLFTRKGCEQRFDYQTQSGNCFRLKLISRVTALNIFLQRKKKSQKSEKQKLNFWALSYDCLVFEKQL
jgi:hypothetical protein